MSPAVAMRNTCRVAECFPVVMFYFSGRGRRARCWMPSLRRWTTYSSRASRRYPSVAQIAAANRHHVFRTDL